MSNKKSIIRDNGCKPCSVCCKLIHNDHINKEIFRLVFMYTGAAPRAGQFFMVKPKRSSVFLGRPISVAAWKQSAESSTLTFLIALRGKGTREMASMRIGDEAELIGPLGNAWADFLPPLQNSRNKPMALVGGGIGIAPINALLGESPGQTFDLYAGFKTGFSGNEEKNALMDAALVNSKKIIIASEDGKSGEKGLITGFLEPEKYAAVCACGPEPMLKAVAAKCRAAGVPCFISMERRMACGVGACLGCTVKTVHGNRRCCADGPIFNAEDINND